MNFVRRDYIDLDGIPRRVLIPESETDNAMGIPVSLELSDLFGHMPVPFQQSLYEALHAQGLVEASDFFLPDAGKRFRAAMLSVIKHDFLSVQTIAKEEL